MKTKFLLLSIFLSLCLVSKATTVNVSVTAGSLETSLPEGINVMDVTDLIITGTIDQRDFVTMKSMKNLKNLDINGATIVAYTEGSKTYRANAIPENALYTPGVFPFGQPSGADSLQVIKLSPTVTRIEISAFNLAKKLHTVDFGINSKLDTINGSAFSNSPKLTSISIPQGVKYIGTSAFSNDSSLVFITLPDGLLYLGGTAFNSCTSLTEITIPAGIKTLSNGTFQGCANLTSIDFAPNSQLETMGNSAIQALPKLKKFKIPALVTNVGTAFAGFLGDSILVESANTTYSSLEGALASADKTTIIACPVKRTSFVIPASVTTIGEKAFYECKSLTSISIPSGVTTIGKHAFANCWKLADVTLDGTSSLETISDNAFTNDSLITSFTIPNTVKNIETYAFASTGVTSVTLPASVINLKDAFRNCFNLVSADLSALGVEAKALPNYLFQNCRKLKTVKLSASTESIGNYAFASTGLNEISFPESLKTIGMNAFDSDTLNSVLIPASVTSIGSKAFYRVYGLITVHADNENYSSESGVLYDKAKTKLIEAPTALSGSLLLPATVTTIEQDAFCNDSLLTSIELPRALMSIGNYAFRDCKGLKKLIVKNPTPIVFLSYAYPFYSITESAELIVPAGSEEAYKNALKWKDFTNIKAQNLFYGLDIGVVKKVSSNGLYATGYSGDSAFIWTNGDASITKIQKGADGEGVTNDGVVVGRFHDSNYMINDKALVSGGVYKDGEWISLGVGRAGSDLNAELGSVPKAITADGNMIVGMTWNGGSTKVVPYVWKKKDDGSYNDTLVYSYPQGGQGANIYNVSDDGSVACGWAVYAETGGRRHAIVWTSPTEYKLLDNIGSEATSISPNGKYITINGADKPALYDVENDTLIYFGKATMTPTAVTNDGLVVGFRETGLGRKGFFWSDQLGYVGLRDFIDTYASDIELPAFFQFTEDENEQNGTTITDISADGKVLTGWRGRDAVDRRAWVLTLANDLELMNRPLNLKATVSVEERNKVQLTWTAPEVPAGHDLDFYRIYRDNELIKTVESSELAYTDENVHSGSLSYQVSAVYDYSDESSTESPKSDEAVAIIVDSYQLPFVETFDSNSFETNYWTVPSFVGTTAGWVLYPMYVHEKYFVGSEVVFTTKGDRSSYSTSLTSKPLDAKGQNKITASFLYKIGIYGTEVGLRDTIHFEVSKDPEGKEWTSVKSYVLTQSDSTWTAQSLDLTSFVKDKIFKTRFRAVSGANRISTQYHVDEFSVAVESVSAPKTVLAIRENDEEVNISWQDPSGSYALTYAQTLATFSIGNEGLPFIGANKFTSAELTRYKDKYLTSISAYINKKGSSASVDTKLSLAVFVSGDRVITQAISNFEENAWNTFKLENPLQISNPDNLIFGIEVVEHDEKSFPLMRDYSTAVRGKGDIYSEDGGLTWSTLTDAGAELANNWVIIGNVRDAAADVERSEDIVGYEIYRDGKKLNADLISYGQSFVDKTADEGDLCYTVKAFYNPGGLSDASEGCISDESSVEIQKVNDIVVYPNPANDVIYVKADVAKMSLYDAAGSLLIETTENPINISMFANGIYTLKVLTKDGSQITNKVIVRK